MKIREGDRVKFLNDTGGGTVKEIRDSKFAIVLNDDGFEVPVLIRELIPVAGSADRQGRAGEEDYSSGNVMPDENEYTDEVADEVADDDLFKPEKKDGRPGQEQGSGDYYNRPEPETGFEHIDDENDSYSGHYPSGEKPASGKPERNLLLGLLQNRTKEGLEAWLINDSRFDVFYAVLRKDELSFLNIRTGHIDPDTRILIGRFSRDQVNKFITLRIQALFFMRGRYDPVLPAQAEFGMDPVEIFSEGAMGMNDFFDQEAMIVPLISDPHEREVQKIREQEISRLITEEKEDPRPDSEALRRKADPLVEEVDLHIEELVEDHSSLSGREALDIQMARFTTALEGALRGKTKRIVFIHGVGNGKLKYEIRRTLDNKYSRLRYQDASFREYGYGATMVIIRK